MTRPASGRSVPRRRPGQGHFGGAANFDEIDFPTKGFSGLTLRLYDPARAQWSLYWASRRTGTLVPPVVGRFINGRGEFYGDDTYNGKDIRARFVSGRISPADSAHWEQAFSVDQEQTWLTNWIMEISVRADKLAEMTREEQVALIAWLRRPRVVWSAVTERLEECGSVQAAVAGETPAQGSLFETAQADGLDEATRDLERWEQAGIRLVCVLDASTRPTSA